MNGINFVNVNDLILFLKHERTKHRPPAIPDNSVDPYAVGWEDGYEMAMLGIEKYFRDDKAGDADAD